jgi:hypothetical protein
MYHHTQVGRHCEDEIQVLNKMRTFDVLATELAERKKLKRDLGEHTEVAYRAPLLPSRPAATWQAAPHHPVLLPRGRPPPSLLTTPCCCHVAGRPPSLLTTPCCCHVAGPRAQAQDAGGRLCEEQGTRPLRPTAYAHRSHPHHTHPRHPLVHVRHVPRHRNGAARREHRNVCVWSAVPVWVCRTR